MASIHQFYVSFWVKHMFTAGDKHASDKTRLESFEKIATQHTEQVPQKILQDVLLDAYNSLGAHYANRSSLKKRVDSTCTKLYGASFKETSEKFHIRLIVERVAKKILDDGIEDQPTISALTVKNKRLALKALSLKIENLFLSYQKTHGLDNRPLDEKTKAEIASLTETVKEQRTEIAGLNGRVDNLLIENQDLRTKLEKLQAEFLKLAEELQIEKDSNTKKEAEIQRLQRELNEAQRKYAASELNLEKQRIDHFTQIEDLNAENDRLQAEINALKETHKAEIRRLNEELTSLRADKESTESRLQNQIINLTNEVAQLKETKMALEARVKKLEKELADYIKLIGPESESLTHEERMALLSKRESEIALLSKRIEDIEMKKDYTGLQQLIRENPWAFISAASTLFGSSGIFLGKYLRQKDVVNPLVVIIDTAIDLRRIRKKFIYPDTSLRSKAAIVAILSATLIASILGTFADNATRKKTETK